MTPRDTDQIADPATRLLKAAANRHRLMILAYLAESERNVGELEGRLGLSQSALSQHLARLRRDGLVQTRRDAQAIYYALKGDVGRRLLDALPEILDVRTEADPGPEGGRRAAE